jgi:UDP-N-acetylmuramoylalanine--D-glutamate ligase
METESIALEGKHNMKNAMAATSVAKLMQIRKATIRESLSNFQGVEHLESIEDSECTIYQ